jgi:hypothetical protein
MNVSNSNSIRYQTTEMNKRKKKKNRASERIGRKTT